MTTASRTAGAVRSATITEARQHVDIVVGPLDHDSAQALREQVRWVAAGPRRSLELDLSGIQERDAAAILALVTATAARAREAGSELRVVNLPEQHRRDARAFGLRRH